MNPDRPVNLPLPRLALAMPVTAVASILHRITGIVLFVGVAYLCYLLDLGNGRPRWFRAGRGGVGTLPSANSGCG